MVHIVKYEASTSTFFDRDLGNSYIHWFAIFQRFNSFKKNETVFHYCVHPVKCVQSEAFTNENSASTVEQQRLATAFVLELTLS